MKTISKEGVVVTSPSNYFRTINPLLQAQSQDTLFITFISGDEIKENLSWEISHGWLNILEESISRGHLVNAESAIIVLISQRSDETLPHADFVEDLAKGLAASEIWVKDSFLVEHNHYFSYMCSGSNCCPPEGKEIPIQEVSSKDAKSLRERCDLAWDILLKMVEETSNAEASETLEIEFISLVQDVKVRDVVLARIVNSTSLGEKALVRIQECVQASDPDFQPRIVGMVVAVMAAMEMPKRSINKYLELAREDSLARLIEHGLSIKVPAATYRRIFIDAEEATLAQSERESEAITN